MTIREQILEAAHEVIRSFEEASARGDALLKRAEDAESALEAEVARLSDENINVHYTARECDKALAAERAARVTLAGTVVELQRERDIAVRERDEALKKAERALRENVLGEPYNTLLARAEKAERDLAAEREAWMNTSIGALVRERDAARAALAVCEQVTSQALIDMHDTRFAAPLRESERAEKAERERDEAQAALAALRALVQARCDDADPRWAPELRAALRAKGERA